jgi:hypothetical protein
MSSSHCTTAKTLCAAVRVHHTCGGTRVHTLGLGLVGFLQLGCSCAAKG